MLIDDVRLMNPLQDQSDSARRPSLALVAFNSLGDSLIYLMMAENLRRNGLPPVCYGEVGHQLRHWMPQLDLRPYPAENWFEETLDTHDLVILSPPRFLRQEMDARRTDSLRRKYLLICQKAPADWRFDLTGQKRAQLDPEKFERIRDLLDCGGSIRALPSAGKSVVDITLEYLRTRMGLKELQRQVSVSPPTGLVFRRFPRRIVVSPDSAWPEKKDWTPSRFIRLCKVLEEKGYDPHIVGALENVQNWRAMPGNRFDTPVFPDLGDLAAFIFESGAVIANDSGNGHLASFLQVPVVTLYRKKNPLFHWRPDWGPARVVCPRLTLPWRKHPIWRPFIRTSDILAALESLI